MREPSDLEKIRDAGAAYFLQDRPAWSLLLRSHGVIKIIDAIEVCSKECKEPTSSEVYRYLLHTKEQEVKPGSVMYIDQDLIQKQKEHRETTARLNEKYSDRGVALKKRLESFKVPSGVSSLTQSYINHILKSDKFWHVAVEHVERYLDEYEA